MSGNSCGLEIGLSVKHKDKTKIVSGWYFTSTPIHNSDLIVILFTDGTNTGEEGFRFVEFRPKKELKH